MNEFTLIDNELALVRDSVIYHVFERDTYSKTAYDYMIRWVQDNTLVSDDPDESWEKANKAWAALSPDFQGILISITNKEKQQARDIRDGLLATLHGYQGAKNIKDSFAQAISECFTQW